MVELWTDGACSGNGTENAIGGWAFLVVRDGAMIHSAYDWEKNTTNNRMEYTAVLKGLEWCKSNYPNEPIICYSDSALLINTANNWIFDWCQNNWKRKSGEIKNLDLVKELYSYVHDSLISFKKIHGHAGIEYNELCDQLAVKARSEKTGENCSN